MPFRLMNIEELSDYLHIDTAEIKELVKKGEIPFEKRGDRLVFRVSEIDEWASKRILQMPGDKLSKYHQNTTTKTSSTIPALLMPELIKPEYIEPQLEAKTKASVIREMVNLADKNGLIADPAELTEQLIAREELCSTGMPGGIAILHTRDRHPYMFNSSFIAAGKTIQEIFFGAPDGNPTNIFFLVCCKEDQLHLHTIARVCMLVHKTDMLEQLRNAATANEMFEIIVNSEAQIIT